MSDNETPQEDLGEQENAGIDLPDMAPGAAANQAQKDSEKFEETGGDAAKLGRDLEAVYDVPVNITAILGRTYMDVSELLKLEEGNVLELDRKVGEAIDIFVNNRLIARGEVVMVEDRLGITMTEIVKGEAH